MPYDVYDDEYWDNWNGEICVGCDLPSHVDDLGLCSDCSAKLNRDMIRSRDWDRSATGFLTPDHELENLRTRIIREYGRDYELIVPPTEAELKAIQAESRRTPTTIGELPDIAPRLMGEYTQAEVVDVLEQILVASPIHTWRELQEVSQLLRRYFPDLNPKVFGYKGLRRLVQAHPKQFQTMWDEPKKKHKGIILIRLNKDHTTHVLIGYLDQPTCVSCGNLSVPCPSRRWRCLAAAPRPADAEPISA